MLKYLQKANSDVTRKITVNIGQFRTVLIRGIVTKESRLLFHFNSFLLRMVFKANFGNVRYSSAIGQGGSKQNLV